jgi:outer membrane protein OmpA-like peptidoglycan-associated protein
MIAAPGTKAASSGCDKESQDRAEKLFSQARSVSGTQQRLELYRQSVEICPKFANLYTLGRTHFELHQPEQALEAFDHAGDLVDAGPHKGLLTGRIAEAQLAMEDLPAAVAAVESAVEMMGERDLPEWLMRLRREIDMHPRRDLVSAADLGETVRAMRAFGVSPRIDVRVLFDYDSDRINDKGQHQVEALGRALRDQLGGGERVLIIGHTDRHGAQDYNQDLSERRARSVILELSRYVPELAGRLQAEGRGESRLKYAGESRDDDRLNRRVEVRVLSQ